MIRLWIGDVKVECDTPAEASEIVRLVGSQRQRRSSQRFPSELLQNLAAGLSSAPPHGLEVPFLQTITASGKGVSSKDLASTLGVKKTTALGPISRATEKTLRSIGEEPRDVYGIDREGQVPLWVPGPRAKEALRKMEGSEGDQMHRPQK